MIHVMSAAGDEQQLWADASGQRLVSGPTEERPDAEDRAENKLLAEAAVDYQRAVRAVEGEVDGA